MKQVITCLWWFYFSTPDPSTGILMTTFVFIYNIKCLVLQHMKRVLTQPVCYVTAREYLLLVTINSFNLHPIVVFVYKVSL